MFLSFVIDHPDPSTLEHAFHLLWGSCGGKVHILRSLPGQQVTYSTSSYPQFMLVLHKQLWVVNVQESTPQDNHNRRPKAASHLLAHSAHPRIET